jgi:hypothetical protein
MEGLESACEASHALSHWLDVYAQGFDLCDGIVSLNHVCVAATNISHICIVWASILIATSIINCNSSETM